MSMENIRKELKELCKEYVSILENLKNNDIITDDEFEKCANNKILFIEE